MLGTSIISAKRDFAFSEFSVLTGKRNCNSTRVVYILFFAIDASGPMMVLVCYNTVSPVCLLDFYYRCLTTICFYITDEQLKLLNEKNKELEAAQDRNAAIQVREELDTIN